MDDLDQREAFLKAIFAAPDDDLPRLVFADWLDERGESDWAELIRLGCRLARWNRERDGSPHDLYARKQILERQVFPDRIDPVYGNTEKLVDRGFVLRSCIRATVDMLTAPLEFRSIAALSHPDWYGADLLKVTSGLIASSKPISTILTSPVTQKVTRLDLSGGVVETTPSIWDESGGEHELPLTDFTYRPTVTLQAVEALVNARECRRFSHLDLRNNDLDNDAARVILRSTNLTRLQSLHLFDGNRLRGRTWAQLVDRFGEENVS